MCCSIVGGIVRRGKRTFGRETVASALRDWVQVGLSPADFFELPDWAVGPVFEGAAERDRAEWKRAAYMAWHAGVLSHPMKKFPKLEKMYAAFEPSHPVSADEFMSALRAVGGANG